MIVEKHKCQRSVLSPSVPAHADPTHVFELSLPHPRYVRVVARFQAESMDSDSMTPGETSGCQPGAGSFETDANTPVGRVHEPAAVLPSLPPDVWGAVARAAFEAEGGTIVAWIRCSLVNRAWRDELRGEPVPGPLCTPGRSLAHEARLICPTILFSDIVRSG